MNLEQDLLRALLGLSSGHAVFSTSPSPAFSPTPVRPHILSPSFRILLVFLRAFQLPHLRPALVWFTAH